MFDSCYPSRSVAMFDVKLNLIQTLVQSLLALYLRLLASAYLYVFGLSALLGRFMKAKWKQKLCKWPAGKTNQNPIRIMNRKTDWKPFLANSDRHLLIGILSENTDWFRVKVKFKNHEIERGTNHDLHPRDSKH